MKDILLILLGIFGVFLLNFIKGKIFKKSTQVITPVLKKVEEEFNSSKLKEGLASLTNKVNWAKTLTQEFSLRTWIARIGIILTIAGIIYGYAYFKGVKSKPIEYNADFEKEISVISPDKTLKFHKSANSNKFEWINMKTGKRISYVILENLPETQAKLKPFGFIFKPYFSFGGAVTNKGIKQDIGVGVNLFKYYKWRMGGWLSNNGVYVGTDYCLTENFAVGAGFGKAYKGGDLLAIRGQWKF